MNKNFFSICVGSFMIQGLLFGDCTCHDDYYKQWIGIGHNEGRGIGYQEGYTTFSTFLTAQKDFFCFCPIMDLRWHLFNHGKSAGNFGLGARTFLNKLDSILGLNLFYDFRQTWAKTYQQMGLGFEWIGPCYEVILNSYIPIGPMRSHFYKKITTNYLEPSFDDFFDEDFLMDPITTTIFRKREFDFGGIDSEVRRRLFDNGTLSFDGGLGPYYYFGQYKKNIYGAMIELKANVLDYVVVSGRLNYDSVFRTTMNAQITIQFPFGCDPFRTKQSPPLEQKLIEKVKRQEVIPVKDVHSFESSIF